MTTLQAFQTAINEFGFSPTKTCADGTVLWFKKAAQKTATKPVPLICIDWLTNSATVYWQTSSGRMKTKAFRSVSEFQAWYAVHENDNS